MTQMRSEKGPFGDPAEQTERRFKSQNISHCRAAVLGFKKVIVLQKAKGSSSHSILKERVRAERGDLARESLGNPEMLRFPRHLLSKLKQARASSADDSFTRTSGGFDMRVNVACEIEAGCKRSTNPSCGRVVGTSRFNVSARFAKSDPVGWSYAPTDQLFYPKNKAPARKRWLA